MRDWLVSSDADLKAWADNFVNVAAGSPAHFGITLADVTDLANAAAALGNAMVDRLHQETLFRATVATQKDQRMAVYALARSFSKRVQITSTVTDADRLHLQLTVRKKGRSRHTVGIEIPTVALNVIGEMTIIHFGTDAPNEQRNGLVKWAIGCNIYRKLQSESEFRLIDFDTSSPYEDTAIWPPQQVQYAVAYRGRRAHEVGGMSVSRSVVSGVV